MNPTASGYTLLFSMAFPGAEELGRSLKKYYNNYNIEFLNIEDLHFKDFYPEKSFIFCDRDSSLKKARQTGMPVIAVSHSCNREESLFGSPFMIVLEEAASAVDILTPMYLEKVYCRHHLLPLQIARTPRLILRELTMSDLNDVISLDLENISDSDALFFPPEYLSSRFRDLHCETFLKNYIRNQYRFFDIGFYGVFEKEHGQFAGLVGFNTPEDRYIEIGYSLKEKFRRRGIGTEALSALLGYFRTYYPSLDVIVTMKEPNTASRKLAEKFGIRCIIH